MSSISAAATLVRWLARQWVGLLVLTVAVVAGSLMWPGEGLVLPSRPPDPLNDGCAPRHASRPAVARFLQQSSVDVQETGRPAYDTNSQTLGELDKKGRSMSVHPDRSHQLAISHVGISQGSNDADRPRQHPCARLSARPKPDQQQPLAEIPHPFLNSKNAASTFNSVAMKKLLLFPENMIPLCCAVQNESCRKGSIEELAKLFEDYP